MIKIIMGIVLATVLIVAVLMPVTLEGIEPLTNGTVYYEVFQTANNTYNTTTHYPIDMDWGVVIQNASGTATLAYGTNWEWQNVDSNNRSNGTIYWKNIPATWKDAVSNRLNMTYAYEGPQFAGSTTRTILSLLPLMVGLVGLVGLGVAMYGRFKR